MKTKNQNGNVLFIILIAVALFGMLSFAISKSSRTNGENNGSSEKSELIASNLMDFNSAIRVATMNMTVNGIDPATIDFTTPGDVGFNTPPFDKKVFHPQGGGVSYQTLPNNAYAAAEFNWNVDYANLDFGKVFNSMSPISNAYAGGNLGNIPIVVTTPPNNGGGGIGGVDDGPIIIVVAPPTDVSKGRFFGSFNNYGWTPTSANDVVASSMGLSKSVCQALNKKITGSTAIPVVANSTKYLVSSALSSTANAALTSTECASCNNQPSMCLADSATGPYNFYSLLVER